jgi:hypothetical protein
VDLTAVALELVMWGYNAVEQDDISVEYTASTFIINCKA